MPWAALCGLDASSLTEIGHQGYSDLTDSLLNGLGRCHGQLYHRMIPSAAASSCVLEIDWKISRLSFIDTQ